MMKKTVSLLLALWLLMSASLVLAEAAPDKMDLAAEDFTLSIAPGTPYVMDEKENGQALLSVYPAYLPIGDETTRLDVVWLRQTLDIASAGDVIIRLFVMQTTSNMVNSMKSHGLDVTSYEVLDYGKGEVDGRRSVYYTFSCMVDYSGMDEKSQGMTMPFYYKIVVVSGPFGIYSFQGTSNDADTLALYVEPLVESIRWNPPWRVE